MGLFSDLNAIEVMHRKTMMANFHIDIDMTTSQIFEKMGTPLSQKQKGKKTICQWKKQLEDGQNVTVKILFVDSIAKKINSNCKLGTGVK